MSAEVETCSEATKSSPGRRRSQQSYAAIMKATVELLEECGYGGINIEALARRAGVGKQTIYRWWTCKAAIVMEAYSAQAAKTVPVPDTGSVCGDLLQVLQHLCEVLNTTAGLAMTSLIAEAQIDPKVGVAFREQFIKSRRETVRIILQRGIERGEIRENVNMELAIDTFYAPVWYRLLLKHAPLDEEFTEEVVNLLMQGLVREKA